MTLRHLQIFKEVAHCESMSEAANMLFLSQPTVSQAIKDLEKHFGVLLFERRPKKLLLTEHGKYLLEYSLEVIKTYDHLESRMKDIKDKELIRIGATISVGNSIINDIVKEFSDDNPNVGTFVCVNNTEEIESKILDNKLDIGLIEGEIRHKDLQVIPAVNDLLVLVCNNAHHFCGKRLIPLYELGNEKFHLREKGSGTRLFFENFCKRNKIDINCVFESNCPSAIKKSIIENNNLSVMSIRLCQDEIKNGTLHAIKPPGEEWARKFSIVYHKDKKITNNLKSLMRIIKKYNDENLEKGIEISTLCPLIDKNSCESYNTENLNEIVIGDSK